MKPNSITLFAFLFPKSQPTNTMNTPTLALAAVLTSTSFTIAGTAVTTSPIVTPPPAPSQGDWAFELSPYIWAAFVDADMGLPWNGPGLSPSTRELDTKITGAFMIAGKARYRSFGVFGDFNWLRLDTETERTGLLYSGADLKTDYIYATAGFSYTLPLDGCFQIDLLAGACLWNIDSDFTLHPGILAGRESGNSATTVLPLLGVDMRYDLNPKWQLLGRATVSGDADDNSQWDLYAGVGYQFTDWCLGTLGYRYFSEEFDKSNLNASLDAHGMQIGVTFRF
jgi:hypothetical protein